MSKSSQGLTPDRIRAIGAAFTEAANTASQRMMALGRAFDEGLKLRNPPRTPQKNDE